MYEEVDVARAQHERPAELEGIPSQSVLAVPGPAGPRSGRAVQRVEHVKQVRPPQPRRPVRRARFVEEQGESDRALLAEGQGVPAIAQADRGEAGA